VAVHLVVQRPQDVQIHRQLADLALRLGQPTILNRRRPGLQPLTPAGEELLTPGADPPGRLTRLTRQQIQRLTAQQAHHDPLLAPRAPAHFALAYGSLLSALDIPLHCSIHTGLRDSRHADLLGLIECPVRTGREGLPARTPLARSARGDHLVHTEDTDGVLAQATVWNLRTAHGKLDLTVTPSGFPQGYAQLIASAQ
jgi:hypothetical protein